MHWHPGWMKDDIELVRRGSIGRSPPLTSYVLTARPPYNALHALLGDTWGTLVFILLSLRVPPPPPRRRSSSSSPRAPRCLSPRPGPARFRSRTPLSHHCPSLPPSLPPSLLTGPAG